MIYIHCILYRLQQRVMFYMGLILHRGGCIPRIWSDQHNLHISNDSKWPPVVKFLWTKLMEKPCRYSQHRQYLMERWKPRSYLPAHNRVLFDRKIFNIVFALTKHCLIYSEIFRRNKCSHCWLSSHKTVEANARPMPIPYRLSGSCDIDGSVQGRYFFPYWEYWEPAIIVKKRETPRVLNQCTEESFAKGCNWLIRVLVKGVFAFSLLNLENCAVSSQIWMSADNAHQCFGLS